jgi:hypothetical protein
MDENDSGIYDMSGAQPTVEGTNPEGGGAASGSYSGGNKRDPVSSSPSTGHTIAGRDINTGAPSDISNAGHGTRKSASAESETRSGGTETEARGVTGTSGTGPTSAHGGADTAKEGT